MLHRPAASSATESGPIFLVDAGEMSVSTTAKSSHLDAQHLLDRPERLLACCKLIREKRPEARLLVFLESSGYGLVCSSGQHDDVDMTDLSAFRSAFQCVPFGSQASTFLLELASRRTACGADVAVISNNVDVVVHSRAPGTKWRHLGFMFIEGDMVLPGLEACQASKPALMRTGVPATASLHASVDGVRRTIMKARSSTHLGGHNQLRSRQGCSHDSNAQEALAGSPEKESCQETQMQEDSDLDGIAESMAVDDSAAYAETQVVVDIPCDVAPLLGDAYADTQVEVEPATSVSGIAHAPRVLAPAEAANAYADTQLDLADPEQEAIGIDLLQLHIALEHEGRGEPNGIDAISKCPRRHRLGFASPGDSSSAAEDRSERAMVLGDQDDGDATRQS